MPLIAAFAIVSIVNRIVTIGISVVMCARGGGSCARGRGVPVTRCASLLRFRQFGTEKYAGLAKLFAGGMTIRCVRARGSGGGGNCGCCWLFFCLRRARAPTLTRCRFKKGRSRVKQLPMKERGAVSTDNPLNDAVADG